MADNKSINYNELLVEFEFVVDLDLAIFKMIRDKYSDSEYVDKNIIGITNEYRVIDRLLSRPHINLLEYIMPDVDTSKLYNELITTEEEELLKYAIPYDTFYLMITFLNNASSVGITIWCKNKLEADYIKSLNPKLNTIIIPERSMIDITKYTAIYMKYFANAMQYKNLYGKHIYIIAAKYNFEEDKNAVSIIPTVLFGDVNSIKLMDPYTQVKYRYEGDNDDDLFEYSAREEGTRDSKSDAWYNFGIHK